MAACMTCNSEVVAGARWCGVCHTSVINVNQGKLSSPARRLAAYLLDAAIPFTAIVMMMGAAAAIRSAGLFALLLLGYMGWALVLFARGTTPGKNALDMEVIDESGKQASFGKMFVREWIGKFISGFVFGLGYIWILLDRDRQGWHDKLVSTYVVDRPK